MRATMRDTTATVTLITFGIGTQVWERFGHNALWIHDPRTGEDIAYNWGLFDFEQPGFLRRFLTGDTRYWMAGGDAIGMVEAYRRIGRPVTLQRLRLTDRQTAQLRTDLARNALEENKYYRYDYFRDNCSTRLRDALDRAVGGAIRRATDSAGTDYSYRRESVRLTDGVLPVQAGIDLALGHPADAALTEWQSFFVPMRLRDGLRHVRVSDGAAGGESPLVLVEETIAPASGSPAVVERPTSPRLFWRYLAGGLLLAALVVGLRIMMLTRRTAAWGLAIFGAGWWLITGILGVLIALAWLATQHVFWARNENLLLLTPFSLALVVLGPMSLLRGRAMRAARLVAALVAVAGVVAALLALVPTQENRAIIALFLPVHLALAWALALPRIGPAARE